MPEPGPYWGDPLPPVVGGSGGATRVHFGPLVSEDPVRGWEALAQHAACDAFDQVASGLRSVARADALVRGVDQDYVAGEAVHELCVALGRAVVPWLLGLGDPLADVDR